MHAASIGTISDGQALSALLAGAPGAAELDAREAASFGVAGGSLARAVGAGAPDDEKPKAAQASKSPKQASRNTLRPRIALVRISALSAARQVHERRARAKLVLFQQSLWISRASTGRRGQRDDNALGRLRARKAG